MQIRLEESLKEHSQTIAQSNHLQSKEHVLRIYQHVRLQFLAVLMSVSAMPPSIAPLFRLTSLQFRRLSQVLKTFAKTLNVFPSFMSAVGTPQDHATRLCGALQRGLPAARGQSLIYCTLRWSVLWDQTREHPDKLLLLEVCLRVVRKVPCTLVP